MSKGNRHVTTDMDLARDELFAHINRCGVLKATGDQQTEWMEDTVTYLGERFTGLSTEDLGELREIGQRFCQPVIPHGKENTALSPENGVADGSADGVAPISSHSKESVERESEVAAA